MVYSRNLCSEIESAHAPAASKFYSLIYRRPPTRLFASSPPSRLTRAFFLLLLTAVLKLWPSWTSRVRDASGGGSGGSGGSGGGSGGSGGVIGGISTLRSPIVNARARTRANTAEARKSSPASCVLAASRSANWPLETCARRDDLDFLHVAVPHSGFVAVASNLLPCRPRLNSTSSPRPSIAGDFAASTDHLITIGRCPRRSASAAPLVTQPFAASFRGHRRRRLTRSESKPSLSSLSFGVVCTSASLHSVARKKIP